MDGKPVYSCSQLAVWANGRSIQTVEGLLNDPLQQAFVAHDAPQCGFCTSGQLMSAKALIERDAAPDRRTGTRGDDRQHLPLLRLQPLRRRRRRGRQPPRSTRSRAAPAGARAIGAASSAIAALTRRRHARRRASTPSSGHREGDLQRRRHAAGHALRARAAQPASARAHPPHRRLEGARAARREGRSSRTRTARSLWGAGSISGGAQYNEEIKKITKHRRYAFNNPVRFAGEPVAAVAAIDRHIAEEALQLIAVDYEPLPFVLDPEEALKPGAPQIWPEGNLSPNARNEHRADRRQARQRRGGIRRRPIACSRIATPRRSSTTRRWNRASASRRGTRDKLTVYTPTGGIANCRTDMARDLGIPQEKVRVVCRYMGGNFGNKNQNHDADLIAAVLAKERRRAGEARAVAQGRLDRRARPLADARSTTRSA